MHLDNLREQILLYFRLSEPESVQYFQSDKDGNIFIFAPGSGCSGEAKLVRPGDELPFGQSNIEGNVMKDTMYMESQILTNSTGKVEKLLYAVS